MKHGTRHYQVWVLLYPATDLPGTWIAHSLHFDVVSTGPTPHSALGNLHAALKMVIQDDLDHGLDPADRPQAPEEDWKRLLAMLQHGEWSIGHDDLKQPPDPGTQFATQLGVRATEDFPDPPKNENIPPMLYRSRLRPSLAQSI